MTSLFRNAENSPGRQGALALKLGSLPHLIPSRLAVCALEHVPTRWAPHNLTKETDIATTTTSTPPSPHLQPLSFAHHYGHERNTIQPSDEDFRLIELILSFLFFWTIHEGGDLIRTNCALHSTVQRLPSHFDASDFEIFRPDHSTTAALSRPTYNWDHQACDGPVCYGYNIHSR